MDDKIIKENLYAYQREIIKLQNKLHEIYKKSNSLVEGKKVKIINKNYNGQPYGSSKKSLLGRKFLIKYVVIDEYDIYLESDIDSYCSMRIEQIEFIEWRRILNEHKTINRKVWSKNKYFR